jgi:hypothetical protein
MTVGRGSPNLWPWRCASHRAAATIIVASERGATRFSTAGPDSAVAVAVCLSDPRGRDGGSFRSRPHLHTRSHRRRMHGEPAPWDFLFASILSCSLRCVLLLPLRRPDLSWHRGELSTLLGMVLEPALRDFCPSPSPHIALLSVLPSGEQMVLPRGWWAPGSF